MSANIPSTATHFWSAVLGADQLGDEIELMMDEEKKHTLGLAENAAYLALMQVKAIANLTRAVLALVEKP